MKKNSSEQIPSISLSRSYFFWFYSALLIFPMLLLLFYELYQSRVLVFSSITASILIIGGGFYYLHTWERKIQRKMRGYIKLQCFQLQQNPSQEIEINHLRNEIAQMQRSYEHQVDLLQSSVGKSKEEARHLHLEMEKKLEQMRSAYLEFEDLRLEYHRLEEELVRTKEEMHEKTKHKEALINEYQLTMSEQRGILEKKQAYIGILESKVNNLMHEMRELLKIETASRHKSKELMAIELDDESRDQLQRYVEIAENLGFLKESSSRFLDLSMDNTIDQRRLFEAFRDETSCVVFLYSLVDQKFLFVNRYVKTMIGWHPDKFMLDFPRLVVKGYNEWRRTIELVSRSNERKRVLMLIKNKDETPARFECRLKMISKGPFAYQIVGTLHACP